jgi:hypothetical protein
MIENLFHKWLKSEVDVEYDMDDLKSAITDDDWADSLWEEFSIYHRQYFTELVREQVRAILKKK